MTPPSPHEAIRNLLGLYCELLDAGDFDGLGDLFADGVLADDDGREVARGRDAVVRLYRGGTRLHGGSPLTRHLTTNTIIDVDEEAGTATARSAYVVLQATDALALQPIVAGRYRDRFERAAGGGWRFAERAFAIDLTGDLSQHLRYEVEAS
jgi:3-phenylpropionate/cinnamic acid dioxygenase small subunit